MTDATLFKTKSIDVTFTSGQHWFSSKERIHALKGINFSLLENESIGIIGESGSGKTTLIRTLIGLQNVCSGEIIYRGLPLNQVLRTNKNQFFQDVQIVFQDPQSSLNPKLSIQSQLRAPLRCLTQLPNQEIDKRIMDVIDRVRLPHDALYRRPRSFSGGQAQRIAIARALLTRPKLIILDEAVSALDVSVQATILNLLKDLRESSGVQFLFVGHDLATVEYLCPKLIVMKEGEIVETGTREEILKHPKEEYTQKLIESIFQIN